MLQIILSVLVKYQQKSIPSLCVVSCINEVSCIEISMSGDLQVSLKKLIRCLEGWICICMKDHLWLFSSCAGQKFL